MNPDSQPRIETGLPSMTELETKLYASAPQPRAGIEAALAQRLRQEFVQRGHAKQVLTSVPPRKHRRLSMGVAVVLVAVLTLGIGVVIAMSTFLQQYIDHDAGLRAIYEQGLGHEIGISQTIDDFTVTLEWAYADGNRLTLAYTIQGQRGAQYTNLSSDDYALTLRDTGDAIPFYQGMAALIDQNGEAVGWGAPPEPIPTSDRSLIIHTYDLSGIDLSDRAALDLHLEVDAYGITLQQRTLMPIERFNDMKEGPEGHFVFDFSISLVDERRVFNTPLTATDQDITVILQSVNVSPSQTRVVICFAPPDPARQWTAIPSLTTNGEEVPGGGGVLPFMQDDLACNDYTYFAGMYEYTGAWQLEVTELIGFGSGGGDDQQRIAGNWRFEFTVP